MGVYLDKKTGRYVVRIQKDGKRVRYGSYETLEEAQFVHVNKTESELSQFKLNLIEVDSRPIPVGYVERAWDKVLDWKRKRRQRRLNQQTEQMVADKIEKNL